MTDARYRRILAGVTLVALGVRVAWVLWATREPTQIFLDPARYLGYARQIADGNGMVEGFTGDPTAYYPPGYPWFLGVIVWAAKPFTDQAWVVAGYCVTGRSKRPLARFLPLILKLCGLYRARKSRSS